MTGRYGIKQFIADAREILDEQPPLPQLQEALGVRLVQLSECDDLTAHGRIIGPSDASFNSYLLWREPPHLALVLAQFEPWYRSPVHEHGEHWVVSAGYRGQDRWDVYERLDGRVEAGPTELRLARQTLVEPGTWTALEPPPSAIHSHNNLTDGFSSELIFSAVPAIPRERRLLYDVHEQTCRVSWFGAAEHVAGGAYPEG